MKKSLVIGLSMFYFFTTQIFANKSNRDHQLDQKEISQIINILAKHKEQYPELETILSNNKLLLMDDPSNLVLIACIVTGLLGCSGLCYAVKLMCCDIYETFKKHDRYKELGDL